MSPESICAEAAGPKPTGTSARRPLRPRVGCLKGKGHPTAETMTNALLWIHPVSLVLFRGWKLGASTLRSLAETSRGTRQPLDDVAESTGDSGDRH